MLSTDEDIRAAEREQWDDGTNYPAVAPGVIVGYERFSELVPAPASTAGMANTPVPTMLPTTRPVADVRPSAWDLRCARLGSGLRS
ncbi:MAG TPA: arginine deiminase family protein [Trebonia sp.]|nr:arginine deiminase family protein [Trebonia sp.]